MEIKPLLISKKKAKRVCVTGLISYSNGLSANFIHRVVLVHCVFWKKLLSCIICEIQCFWSFLQTITLYQSGATIYIPGQPAHNAGSPNDSIHCKQENRGTYIVFFISLTEHSIKNWVKPKKKEKSTFFLIWTAKFKMHWCNQWQC